MEATKINILYVDDEINNLMSFKATFRLKYKVLTAASGSDALEVLAKNDIDIVITDQRMPGMTGVEFLEQVRAANPDLMRILLTGYTDVGALIDAVNKGKIFHYLSKPWSEEELDNTIQRAFTEYKKNKETKELNSTLTTTNDQLEFLLRQKLLS